MENPFCLKKKDKNEVKENTDVQLPVNGLYLKRLCVPASSSRSFRFLVDASWSGSSGTRDFGTFTRKVSDLDLFSRPVSSASLFADGELRFPQCFTPSVGLLDAVWTERTRVGRSGPVFSFVGLLCSLHVTSPCFRFSFVGSRGGACSSGLSGRTSVRPFAHGRKWKTPQKVEKDSEVVVFVQMVFYGDENPATERSGRGIKSLFFILDVQNSRTRLFRCFVVQFRCACGIFLI